MVMKTDIDQFILFHKCLTKNNPEFVPFYFPLNINSKDPFEGISWKKNKATFEQAIKYLKMGHNIGIAATDKDKLVIMDKDNLESVGQTKPTLTVTSRKRIGEHGFYFTDDKVVESDIFEDSAKQNIATDNDGEIRANWQYVVCAGSYVPVTDDELQQIPEYDRINAGKYTVRSPIDVNTITFKELPQVYISSIQIKRETEISKKLLVFKKVGYDDKHSTNKSALFNLTIEDVTGKLEDGAKRFPSLFHDSSTGMNSSIKNGLFHCWRHNVSHSPLSALAVIAGLGTCNSIGFAHHGRGGSEIDFSDGKIQFKLWEYAKKNKYISTDDPIPSKALVWFAISNKICDSSSIIDSWKLPIPTYNEALNKLVELKLNPGRKAVHTKRYNRTDWGNAQRLVDRFGNIIRFCHPYNSWYNWNTKYWEKDESAKIYRFAKETVKQMYYEAIETEDIKQKEKALEFAIKCESQPKIKSMIESATSEPGIPIIPTTFDKNTMIFNVQNGTIDLKTIQLKPHDRTDYLTKISPVVYDSNATCPRWIKFLKEVFDNRIDLIEYMQRQAGYYLTGEVKEEDFSIYYGTGGNGKSKYINQLLYILGDYGMKVKVETILESKSRTNGNAASSDVARLKGARLVIASEPEFGAELKEGLIKDLTGRERITARHLYQEEITFDPTFKLVLITNHRVNIKSQDKGVWRRVKETPFIVTIPDDKVDRDLDIKLREESAGILNWMLEGCKKWQESGLKVPNEVIAATKDYKEDMDVLGEFIRLCCVDDGKAVTPNRWLYNLTYLPYCEVMSIKPWSQKAFSSSLRDRENGYKIIHTRNGNAWEGIGLNLHISQFLSHRETNAANGVVNDVRDVTRFLESFLCTPSRIHFMYNTSHLSHPSQSIDTAIEKSTVKDIREVKDLCDFKEQSASKKTKQRESVFQSNVLNVAVLKDQSQITELTKTLYVAKSQYEHNNCCVLNSSNILEFSIWVCDLYRPFLIGTNNERIPYTYASIKGIANKLFDLTPVQIA
jgi:putative DNA primase/helicase